jgi:ligand-binding sensor domain-containing protein
VAGNDKATISKPPIGRHQVIMTVTDEASQTFTHKIEFDVLDVARFEARGHLIDPFEAVNAELSASGESGVTALTTDSSGLAFVSNGEQVYAFQSDSLDATPSPLSIDSETSETVVLNDVTAILVWENGDNSHIYLGSDQGVLSCEYTLGTTPIQSDRCRRYENADGDVTPDGQVTSLAKHSIGDRNWLAIGTDSGLYVSADEDGRMGDVVVVTSDEEPIRGVVANGGSFWFATEYNGVYQYDVLTSQIPSLFSTGAPAPPFTTLAVDTGGGLWMGSAGHGLGHFESRTGVWQGWMAGDRFEGLASNTIQCITSGYGLSQGLSREVIWVGTDHGLTRVEPLLPSFTTLATDAGLPSDDVRAVAIAGLSGHVLVGTSEGLALYNGR